MDAEMTEPRLKRRATKLEKIVDQEVKEYSYYDPTLIKDAYAIGDIYNSEPTGDVKQAWEISDEGKPYLAHVKSLSTLWPSLRLLADFMEIGTSPVRWKEMTGNGGAAAIVKRKQEIDERSMRTNVTRLDYLSTGIDVTPFTTSRQLKDSLNDATQETESEEGRFRLYIVEDLSRDVIELLGAHLDIEPGFFREQIFDYAWYNTRDRWVDPPRLNAVTKNQRWIQFRFAAIRYYKSAELFKAAKKEFDGFNVFRRAEDDINNKSTWDEERAIVSLARTRASFWLSGKGKAGKAKGSVGVLLVDPTPTEGSPLWYGYRNWEEAPSLYGPKTTPTGPPRTSIYKDIIYWAQKSNPSYLSKHDPAARMHAPIQALLHLISAEWVEAAEYIRTRLGQIEWEVSFPEHFLKGDLDVNGTLKKLHIWRRIVPLYREMLTETLQRAFQFPCHGAVSSPDNTVAEVLTNANGSAATPIGIRADPANPLDNTVTAEIPSSADGVSTTSSISHPSTPNRSTQQPKHCACPIHTNSTSTTPGPMFEMRDDFSRVLEYMKEYQQRIDRLTSVVTAVISISDSQRSRDDNKNVARLTWLATFFIPLSFVASLFSMTQDIASIKETIKWYFAASLPLALLSLGVALLFTLQSVQDFTRKYLGRKGRR